MTRLLAILLTCLPLAADDFIPFFASGSGNNLLTGLEAFWRFEETTGNAADSSGNGRTLTENGTVGTTINGVVVNARTYADDDETDYFSRASEAVFAFAGDFTITAWADLDNAPPAIDDKTIIARGDFAGANFSWLLLFDSATPNDLFQFYWSTDGIFNAGNVISFDLGGEASTGDYYFITVRRSGTTLGVAATYIGDTSLSADTTGTASGTFFEDGTSTLRVGDLEGSDTHDMRGTIDEMGIWTRYLSDCELTKLFMAKAGTFTYPYFDALTCLP